MDGNHDGLSALPDAVLTHILSLLDSKHAVQTCILSSRWRYLWSYTTRIRLHIDKNLTKELVSKYDKFFLGHQSAMLECLNVGFRINNRTKKHVVKWLCHILASKKVQEVCVSLHRANCRLDLQNELPFHLFNCQSITSLELWNCCLESTSCCGNFSSLRTLKTHWISNETISGFLSTCSSLEHCVITDSNITNISAPWLKTLIVKYHPHIGDSLVNDLDISAPSLQYLELHLVVQNLSLQNVQNLNTAILDVGCNCHWLSCIRQLVNVKKLELNDFYNNGNELQSLQKEVVPLRFHQLKDLKVDIHLVHRLPVLDFLMYSSPNLQLLELKINGQSDDKENSWNDEDVLSGALPSLRRVNIMYFKGTISGFQLIEFLLKKACNLEFLKVQCNTTGAKRELFIARKLSSMPRTSSQLKIETFRDQELGGKTRYRLLEQARKEMEAMKQKFLAESQQKLQERCAERKRSFMQMAAACESSVTELVDIEVKEQALRSIEEVKQKVEGELEEELQERILEMKTHILQMFETIK